jgi:hypothetical protein
MEPSLTIEGMTFLDFEALKSELAAVPLDSKPMPVQDGRHGEPATIALTLILSHATVAGLAVLFGKARRRRMNKTRWRIRRADGTEIEFDQVVSDSQSGTLDPRLLAELKDLGFNVAALTSAIPAD